VPVTCETETPSLENGKQVSKHTGAIVFPKTLRYRCNKGYSTDGSLADAKRDFQPQCKPDAQFVGMMSCQKISCGTPSVLPLTDLTSPSDYTKSIEFEDEAKYKCIEGHTETGKKDGATEFSVKCKANGKLTKPKVCEPVKCGSAPKVQNARAATSSQVSYGMDLFYMCDTGYTLDGSIEGETMFERVCNKDGEFAALSEEKPCKPISAGMAPMILMADMVEYAGKKIDTKEPPPMVTYPNGLEYKCQKGFSENGSPNGPTKITTKVTAQGMFKPALPMRCRQITFFVKGKVKSARSGKAISKAKVAIYDSSGTEVDKFESKSGGGFKLKDIVAGNYTIKYAHPDYENIKVKVEITGDVNRGGVADAKLSPKLKNKEWRAVLNWGAKPLDLDAYAKWSTSSVYSGHTKQRKNQITNRLVTDASNGFGPETMFMSGVGDCKVTAKNKCDIRYLVRDSKKGIADSGAEVVLSSKMGEEGKYKVSDCPKTVTEDGQWWHVFTLNGKTGNLKWSCNNGKEAPASYPVKKVKVQKVCVDNQSGGACKCKGTVYFGRKYVSGKPGKGEKLSFKDMKKYDFNKKKVDGEIACSNKGMPGKNPAKGRSKRCWCESEVYEDEALLQEDAGDAEEVYAPSVNASVNASVFNNVKIPVENFNHIADISSHLQMPLKDEVQAAVAPPQSMLRKEQAAPTSTTQKTSWLSSVLSWFHITKA